MLFRSERGIGRGEMAESQFEVPFFAVFMALCSAALLVVHFQLQDTWITAALAISMLVFAATVLRPEYGVSILVVAMLLSPEVQAGNVGELTVNLRYDDILIIVIFLGVMVKIAFEGRFSLMPHSPINAAIIGYYGVCVFSTLLAYQRALPAWDGRTAAFVMLKMLEYYLVFWLVGHAVRDLVQIRKQLILFFAVSMVVSIYGIWSIGTTPRISTPFEGSAGTEPNTLGGYLMIVLLVAVALATEAPTLRLRALNVAISVIAFVPFLYTLSRASYLGLLAGVVVLGVLGRKWLMLALFAAALFVSPLFAPTEVQERVMQTFAEEHAGTEVPGLGITVDKSAGERVLVWNKVHYMLFDVGGIFTWLGAGVWWESVVDSQYARVILETGLIGLAAFVLLQLVILKTTREAYLWTDDWLGRGLSLGVFAATIALVVHSAGTISFLIVRIMEPFWFLVALSNLVRTDAIVQHTRRAMAAAQPAAPASADTEYARGAAPQSR